MTQGYLYSFILFCLVSMHLMTNPKAGTDLFVILQALCISVFLFGLNCLWFDYISRYVFVSVCWVYKKLTYL